MRRDDLLDLNDVLQHPGRKLAVDISTELPQEEDLDLVKPLEGFLEAVSTGNLLLITGQFSTKAVFECARCGGPVEQDITFDIDEQFPVVGVPSSYNTQDYARVSPDEPFELFEGNNLMVEALIRQGLITNEPLQPLCEYGWDGDCPVAAKRVRASGVESARPEFKGLANLLDKGEKEN
ncbi:MAG: DUF177 domain-containing protein [Armatimonadetes bacterium]|nr:DUF177 domain-containing protein [Armatimonadota bacterium]